MALNMDTIAKHLTDAGFPSYVEYTGGGCATIYAQPIHVEEGWGQRYALLAGPGDFGSPSYGHVDDFGYGADDDGAGPFIKVAANATERSAADAMITFIREALCKQS